MTANIIPLAALMVFGGRLGDLFGMRRVFIYGAVMFAVATTAMGAAQDFEWAIAARAFQGAGDADVLERFDCELILSDDHTPNTGEGANFATKERKQRLLARSKVLLNVHGEEEPYFEWLRAAEAISSGCVLVSEHSTDLQPLRPGVDLITGSIASLGFLTAWVLDDNERRTSLAREADARLRSQPRSPRLPPSSLPRHGGRTRAR